MCQIIDKTQLAQFTDTMNRKVAIRESTKHNQPHTFRFIN